MHSYILIYPFNQIEAASTKILELARLDLTMAVFFSHADVIHINQSVDGQPSQSLKIETIRDLKASLTRNPFELPIQLAVIWQAGMLTTPAQQALLKLLEEPGERTKIFLITEHYHSLLPTILSRCQIVKRQETREERFEINTEELKFVIADLLKLSQLGKTERMVKIEEYTKDKDKALRWLESIIQTMHLSLPSQLSSLNSQVLPTVLKRAQMAYNDLNSNVNLKLTIDQLALYWNTPLDEEAANKVL